MARYRVVVVSADADHGMQIETLDVRARCPEAAYSGLGAHHRSRAASFVTVRRRGPLGLRRGETVTFRAGGPGGGRGDAAGVREPRRPNPSLPSLRRALDEPQA